MAAGQDHRTPESHQDRQTPQDRRRGPLTWILVAIIGVYRRYVSPLLPASCRYYPTCSAYAVQAIDVHGPLRGSVMAARRILSCHPWNPGGYDPVPGARRPSSGPDGADDDPDDSDRVRDGST